MSIEPSALSGTARFADDTRRRFVREIVARVPLDRIVAVHLFTPIRQGGVETGVAVVAARRVVPAPDVAAEATSEAALEAVTEPVADAVVEPTEVPNAEGPVDAEVEAVVETFSAADEEVPDGVAEPEAEAIAEAEAARMSDGEPTTDAEMCDPTEDAARIADAAEPAPVASTAIEEGEERAADSVTEPQAPEPTMDELLAADLASDDAAPAEPAAPAERHTVFTARYRLTVRGPDRGKWDADVVEEADAPLVTVDAVVRGVQRRAGDASEPDRLDAEAVARLAEGRPLAR